MVTSPKIPVFDARSEFHQNLGMLKVAETAARQHGDMVMIHAGDERAMLLLGGTQSIRYWRNHQGLFQTELGDVASNAGTTRILIGDALEQPQNIAIWDATRMALGRINAGWDDWSRKVLVDATQALIADIAAASGAAIDLRNLCSLWSIRALCPALFGRTLPDQELVRGLMEIEQFYFAMSTRGASEIRNPDQLAEFRVARDFLDAVIAEGLRNMHPDDATALACLDRALPQDLPHDARIALLRPALGRLLLEKLNIDGLGLLWALTHLAQDPGLVDDMALESTHLPGGGLGSDTMNTRPSDETPLCHSVICETLRLYPELPFIYRITSREIEISGQRVPARTTILFAPWLLHRDPRYWEKPERFEGDRFLRPLRDRSAYLPFGIGPRVRNRTQFLQHQLAVALRAIVSHFRCARAPACRPGNLRPILRSTLAPRGAVPVCFSMREATPLRSATSAAV